MRNIHVTHVYNIVNKPVFDFDRFTSVEVVYCYIRAEAKVAIALNWDKSVLVKLGTCNRLL